MLDMNSYLTYSHNIRNDKVTERKDDIFGIFIPSVLFPKELTIWVMFSSETKHVSIWTIM
jgi:hypothetical protein